ncbi:MAG: branched-chain amino acid transport system substrate-binding protein [Betaproteobacteria bacterium]|nr:branched-chain amino acid transport system substrate-binding protein [Betaproteobacteria bacterium]
MRALKSALAFAALMLLAGVASAQAVKVAYVGEISGALAPSGGNFRDGVILAVEEINARGGVLKQKLDLTLFDTQTNPGVARAQMQKAIDGDPYVIFGPILSGNVKVTLVMVKVAHIPSFVGGEAAVLTTLGSPYMFRTSFGQQIGMPKIANYIRDEIKAKTVALIWVNNDFGKGGRDRLTKELAARNIKLVADVSTESGQVDFAADVVKLKAANADAVFVYSNEEECARIMREARKQGLKGPFVGDTTLLSQKTIELAAEAANGVVGHVGLTVDAPMKEVKDFGDRFQKRFKYKPDHNGLKGYTAVYAMKYVTEKKLGKFDRKALASTLHGLTITPKEEPGILIETTWDNVGEIDRISFLATVVKGQQVISKTLPKLGK